MTKEDLIKATYILIVDHNPTDASLAIWDLWQNFGHYAVINGKILHKETGNEFIKDFPIQK